MNISLLHPRRSHPAWTSPTLWLAAFLSPTFFFLMLLFSARLRINLPQTPVASLLFLIPIGALLICEYVAWTSNKNLARKIGWMLFTLLAMALQLAIILSVLSAILVTMISYAQ